VGLISREEDDIGITDLKVIDAFSEPAKSGFSLPWEQQPVVTPHKHPGTGMFYEVPLRVVVRDGKLQAVKVSTSGK
jgi:hypothetical protein